MNDNLDVQLKEIEMDTDTGKSTIAIIDDDISFSILLKDYLFNSAEIKADLFSNGNDFLKEYTSKDKRKIILDYEFRDHPNGLKILQGIRKINPTAIVIMVSSQDNLETAIETMRNGATDYFLKTNKTVFVNIVSSILKLIELERYKMN